MVIKYMPVLETRIRFSPNGEMIKSGKHKVHACGQCWACLDDCPDECTNTMETMTSMVDDVKVVFDVLEDWPYYTGEISAEKEPRLLELGCMIDGTPYNAPVNQRRSKYA